ncbi:MAG TPA: cytochrome c-type biogenesis protein [Xanthobacteraceae bacterium]|jgi:cytochrome c-type biogenesis protein CcmH|nr:cytochrome c-type biogenesis protein [Xanthobacteraceae bacterium]
MRLLQSMVVALTLLVPAQALAVQPDEVLSDPVLEVRARGLSKELRCMVCQNQSIDDSDAPLAKDLRILVRERLTQGDSDNQVIDFLVARYGDFVLLRPRLTMYTVLLWGMPPALVLGGLVALVRIARRRKAAGAVNPGKPEGGQLTPAEEARLASLLKSGET